MKSLAVYCGHQMGNDPKFAADARRLGKLMAENNIRLVFGGGRVGLMGVIADTVLEHGGKVLGVSTVHVSQRQEPVHNGGVELIMAAGVNERKQIMFDESNAFCILPGGMGTLNELSDILTMQQIGETKKRVMFLDTNGYWDIFDQTFRHMLHNGFIENVRDYRMMMFETPDGLINNFLKKNK